MEINNNNNNNVHEMHTEKTYAENVQNALQNILDLSELSKKIEGCHKACSYIASILDTKKNFSNQFEKIIFPTFENLKGIYVSREHDNITLEYLNKNIGMMKKDFDSFLKS